jgi:hypothetical protein
MNDGNDHETNAPALGQRILNVLPAATYQMDRFLQLVDVVVSDRSETACVEVGPQPKLHVNAQFVDKYCQRDEHLLMLVLHELYHVILGHTTLFPRLTPAQNIVFDAVINALLCHQFREPQYLGFFRRINSWSHFPGRLLRPPPGWPAKPKSLPPAASKQERVVVELLYGAKPETVTYQEILALLEGKLTEEQDGPFVLLGDHSGPCKDSTADGGAVTDELFKEILQRVTADWPEQSGLGPQNGAGGSLADFLMPKAKSPRAEFVVALKRLLSRAGVLHPLARTAYGWKDRPTMQEYVSVLPNWRDRHAYSKELLFGAAPLLYRSERLSRRRQWTPQDISHVYFDVSGSMHDAIPWLVGAMEPLHRKGLCELFVFSTVVDTVKRGKLTIGRLENTGGTDINCVLKHVLEFPAKKTPRKIVVLTDGYTGVPNPKLIKGMESRKVQLYVGLTATGAWSEVYLKPYAIHIERLPNLPLAK